MDQLNSAMKVLIRADASSVSGGGHVVRSSSLGSELLSRGAKVYFATREESFATVPFIRDFDFDFLMLTCAPDDEPELMEQSLGSADLLILDHYHRNLSYERDCKLFCRRLMVMDDLPNRAHDCDLLVDQTLGRRASEYNALLPKDAQVLTGPSYALLRPQFAQASQDGAARLRDRLDTILLMAGASDPLGLGNWVLEGLASSDLSFHLDLISGDKALAERWGAGCGNCSVEFHENVRDMASLMSKADLAIGASGSASWERCCLALPSLQFVVAENQRPISEALVAAGAALNLGDFPGASQLDLLKALGALQAEPARLTEMSRTAASICDGQGCKRVAEELLGLLADEV